MKVNKQIIVVKMQKTLRAGISAWWVFLLMAVYTVFAHLFLGSGCLMSSTTGLPCPGCGGTRAILALMHGNFAESLLFQPILIPAALVLAVYFVIWLTHEKTPRYANIMLICLMILTGGVFAVRMVLMFPHEAPMEINRDGMLPRIISFVSRYFL